MRWAHGFSGLSELLYVGLAAVLFGGILPAGAQERVPVPSTAQPGTAERQLRAPPEPAASSGAGIVALFSLSSTISTHRSVNWDEPGWQLLGLALLSYLSQIGIGIWLTVDKHADGAVNAIAYVMIGSFSVGLGRAWVLVEGSRFGKSSK